jgi:iron(II)-dependent oxidoreductase
MPKQVRPDAHSSDEDVSVHLKPILGIAPGTYLTALLGLALLLMIFCLLVLPGLRHQGSYLSVSTFPDHATVKVDGAYAGSTPCTVFLKHGERAITISKPYYSGVTLNRKVRGRIFATLLVPDRSELTQTLELSDMKGLTGWALADFQKNPQIPTIVSDASFAAYGADDLAPLNGFVEASLLSVTEESQLREILLAAARTASHGAFLTPGSYVSLIQQAVKLLQEKGNSPEALLLALSHDDQDRITATPWMQQHRSAYRDGISKYYQPGSAAASSSGGGVTIRGLAFRAIPAGDLVMGRDDNLDSIGKSIDRLLPHPVRVGPFYLGVTEVPNSLFQAFVNENPDWAPAGRETLMKKGLVTDSYLSDWKDGKMPSGSENLPVTNVSWHAALAFCGWLARSVQSSLPGYTARLPLESEWEWAARGLRGMPYPLGGKPGGAVFHRDGITGASRIGPSEPNGYGLRDMLGNVWEWCADPYAPNAGLLTSLDPVQNALYERSLPDSPDRSVRGGGWANQSGSEKVYTRGSQPVDWCTPFLGFRVALSRL